MTLYEWQKKIEKQTDDILETVTQLKKDLKEIRKQINNHESDDKTRRSRAYNNIMKCDEEK